MTAGRSTLTEASSALFPGLIVEGNFEPIIAGLGGGVFPGLPLAPRSVGQCVGVVQLFGTLGSLILQGRIFLCQLIKQFLFNRVEFGLNCLNAFLPLGQLFLRILLFPGSGERHMIRLALAMR